MLSGGCICDEEEDRASPFECTACPYGEMVADLESTVNVTFVGMENISCSEIEQLSPLVALYHGVNDEESCTAFQEIIENDCGCQNVPTSHPTGSTMPSPAPSSTPTSSSEPTMLESSSPTSNECTDRGFDNTCLFNEDPEERRTAVCLRNIDEETGRAEYRNACWKNKDLEGIVPGDPIGDGSGWTLSACGCCDRCDVLAPTEFGIPELHGPHVKHCRRSAICTPEDDDWEVCFSWGNGVVKTIKACITHEDGTKEETCVEPFYIPTIASDIVKCGGCTNLN